jgi:SAM-dependent methyltransferase
MAEPLARLFAGGRHVRLLVAGRPPGGIAVPDTGGFERVVWLAWPGQMAAGGVVADPQHLPFIEAVFDKALVTTPLPAATARAQLRDLWRILAPAGIALLVVKARRPWQWQAPGWVQAKLAPVLGDAMYEILDWQVATLPDRHHLILVAKRDGLRPALIGRVEESLAPATA